MEVTERIMQLLQDRKITKYRLSKDTGIPTSTISNWTTKNTKPAYEALHKLAEYFGVSVDYFYSDNNNATKNNLMHETDVIDRIFEMMEDRDVTSYYVSQKTGIAPSTFTDWRKRKVYPSRQNLLKLSEFFNVPIDHFVGEEEKRVHKERAVRIPVLGRVPAGIPFEAIHEFDGWEEIPESWTTAGREYFALKVVGTSMWPDYVEGEMLIVRHINVCDNGKDCIVMINGQDATFKRVYLEHGGIRLHPLNPAFKDEFFTAQQVRDLPVSIVGVVVQSRRDR